MWLNLRPLITAYEVGFVFLVLEFLWPGRPRPRFSWARYLTDLLHLSLGSLAIRLGGAVLLVSIMAFAPVCDLAGRLPYWLQIVLLLLISDLSIWLLHRSFHAVPFLWKFHEVHHSSKHLDWLATYRVHPLEQIAVVAAVTLPHILLGFSNFAVSIYSVIYVWHAHLIHANLNVSLGVLDRIFATPRFHHWHHANHVDAYDMNFGAQLVIWDRLFGTCYAGPLAWPERYGVNAPPKERFLTHLASPFTQDNRTKTGGQLTISRL